MFVHIRLRMSVGRACHPILRRAQIGGGKQGRDFEVRNCVLGFGWLFCGCVLADVVVVVLLLM